MPRLIVSASLMVAALLAAPQVQAGELDTILASENSERGETLEAIETIDDLAFLRRASLDLIGRIPTQA